MLNHLKTKTHAMKWVEAEQNLVLHGVSLPNLLITREFFSKPPISPIQQDNFVQKDKMKKMPDN